MLTMSLRSGWSTDSDDDSLDAGGLPEEATSPIIRPSTGSQKRLSLPGGMALEDSFAELMGGPATTSKGRAGGLSDFDDDDPPPRPATSSSAVGGRAGLSSQAASEARGSSTGSALGTARPQTAPARQVRREAWQQPVSQPASLVGLAVRDGAPSLSCPWSVHVWCVSVTARGRLERR